MAYADPENTLVIETTKGKVVIAMRPDPVCYTHLDVYKRQRQRCPVRHREIKFAERQSRYDL